MPLLGNCRPFFSPSTGCLFVWHRARPETSKWNVRRGDVHLWNETIALSVVGWRWRLLPRARTDSSADGAVADYKAQNWSCVSATQRGLLGRQAGTAPNHRHRSLNWCQAQKTVLQQNLVQDTHYHWLWPGSNFQRGHKTMSRNTTSLPLHLCQAIYHLCQNELILSCWELFLIFPSMALRRESQLVSALRVENNLFTHPGAALLPPNLPVGQLFMTIWLH